MADIIEFPEAEDRQSTILVVDDELAIRAILTDFLNECGFKVLAVASADEAQELIRSGASVDLLFSDVRMPGKLDGVGLARWVMTYHSEIPIILVSGDLGKANAATELCGVEMVAKPYDFHAAARKIRDTIKLHRQRRA